MELSVEMFQQEIAEALKVFEKYIICVDKTPDDCEASLVSLMNKAIEAFKNRGPSLRHGIALDKQITIILSQNDSDERPLCGIYFNLHTPYRKNGTQTRKAPVR